MVILNPYAVPPLITSCTALILGLIVAYKSKTKLNQVFFRWCLCVFIWLFSYTICYSITDEKLATLLSKIACTAVLFLAPTFYHFNVIFFKKTKEEVFVKIGYLIDILMIPLIFSTNHILNGVHKFFFGYYVVAGKFYWITLLIFFSFSIRALFLLIEGLKNTALSPKEHQQTQYFLVAFSIAYLGGVDFLPKFGINIYPFGSFLFFIWIILMAYAILKHQILDIKIVIQKSLVYSLLLASLTIIYLLVVFCLESILQKVFAYHSVLIRILIAFVLGVLVLPLRNKIHQIFEKIILKATPIELAEQNELLRSEVAEKEKFKAIATLASGIAHEVKNPLSTLKTFIDYLPAKHNDPEFMSKFSRLGNQEIERVNNLVHNLLNFAKPTPPEFKATDINKLIEETIGLIENSAQKNNITIHHSSQSTVHSSLSLDQNQIKQALLNILLNAIDAMPNGGTLTITTLSKNKFYEIEITDTGSGIAKDDLKHIFEPFFTKKDTGTGLGLSITYGIVEEHKGKIEVESTVGVGTTFRIKLLLDHRRL